MDIKTVSSELEEKKTEQSVIWMGREAFGDVYRYMIRYIERYDVSAYRFLFSLKFRGDETPDEREEMSECLRELLQHLLRNSDIMMQTGDGQFFLLLPEIDELNIDTVTDRVMSAWKQTQYADSVELVSEYERILTNEKKYENDRADWVAVVDDDMTNLQIAGHTLSANGMRVSALKSGESLLNFLQDNSVRMPGIDGFETIQRMKKNGGVMSHIPVIFLTADDDGETEQKGLSLGAMDFIKKPIMPEVLSLRVSHTIELVRLQNHLSQEVDKKAEENEKIFIHVVKSLAEAIDAKDTYTNGHSSRVAEYSRAIAKNAGFTEHDQSEIYMMGLLHDVGKIGVPDEVINKPGKLTDAEFELIKQHPVIGGRILKSITERPKLATGARWHHERYGGGGYPDGLTGEDIPEEARIIAVADAYDAMTSRRSYRDVLPQEKVRDEIERGIGTQFDPNFATIMLRMIDDDHDYKMREQEGVPGVV